MRTKQRVVIAVAAAMVAGPGVAAGVSPVAQGATVRQFEGTVKSVDRDARTFRLRDVQRGTVTVHVRRSTRFERVGGFAGLRAGLTRIEATVVRVDGRWVAREVERSGGGGRHGGGGEDD